MPTFKQADVELYYELEGSGPPVVLIHGFGIHSNTSGSIVLRQLLARQHMVLSVDNRGSGQTITPQGASVTIEDMADDIAAIIDHHRLGAVHTVGYSMGGAIAMMLALRHPQKVCSQVVAVSSAWMPLVSRTTFTLQTVRLMTDAGVSRDLINRIWAIIFLEEGVFQDKGFVDAFVNQPPDALEQTPVGFEQQAGAGSVDLRARLPSLTTPTLVVSAADDFLAPPHFQEELAALIPNAEIKRYPGGHIFMFLPMYMASFVRDVEAFWDKHS